jgi:hypothetical protein
MRHLALESLVPNRKVTQTHSDYCADPDEWPAVFGWIASVIFVTVGVVIRPL